MCVYVCVCAPPLCCKKLCFASRSCTGVVGERGQQVQESARGGHEANTSLGAQSEVHGRSSGGGAPAAPRTRKPGQSAQAESTQGVFLR